MNTPVNFATMRGARTLPNISPLASTEFVVFQLGQREYGINVEHVQRLRGYGSLTRIANGADYVEGVAISDGDILPIVDMRRHVNIALPAVTPSTAVIILNIQNRTIGLVVDSISEVISLTAAHVRPVPSSGSDAMPAPSYLIGCATYQERNLILLDIQKLMGGSGSAARQTA